VENVAYWSKRAAKTATRSASALNGLCFLCIIANIDGCMVPYGSREEVCFRNAIRPPRENRKSRPCSAMRDKGLMGNNRCFSSLMRIATCYCVPYFRIRMTHIQNLIFQILNRLKCQRYHDLEVCISTNTSNEKII